VDILGEKIRKPKNIKTLASVLFLSNQNNCNKFGVGWGFSISLELSAQVS
jgi:hypothetical protein